MRISVIIPAINESAWIQRAVSRAWEAGADEILVVDGGSQDGTVELARNCGAQVVFSARGRAVQQNQGARHVSGDILLFLHADNWLAPQAGRQIREVLRDDHVLGGAFYQHIDAPGKLFRWIERGNALRVRWRGLAYGDQAIFMRKEVFQQLGRFPEVKLMEDLLLMRRFRKLSKPVLLPGPVHVHPRRWQRRGIVRQTLSNWSLMCAQSLGVAPDRLAKFYPSHDP
ncbi:MAG: TIGR04283 family arsenosugar biosynthesis glycosyltransferase [Pirellulales bacterium]|nr:TIGR04283 family arsenosugar biosynthesis glycosyltransferase [Pirellulales bacterium]